MSITQRQLATELGVSQMAVSFALNDKPGVNAETRQRILDAATAAGYRPNAAARATRSGSTRNVELILGLHEGVSRIPTGLLEGVEQALTLHDLHLSLSRLPDEKLVEDGFLPRVVREVAADGLLINYTHFFPTELLALIRRHRIPAVWLNAPVEEGCVRPDDHAAGRMAAEHLLELGHRDPALFFVSAPEHHSGEHRRLGFEEAVAAAGGTPRVTVEASRPYREIRRDLATDERLAYTQRWLARADRPTAVVGYSHAESTMLLIAAARLGLRVPEDLSIVSIADEITPFLGTPLTTVVLPWAAIGRTAVELLCQHFKRRPKRPSASAIQIRPELELGATTGPPGSAAPPA
ncbi:LacI family DNA-binding transcriptional regulator [Phycisphaera mikurensis]|uniref:Putative LacI family transcriptional regulator n=1 Tax=Phycisphaera mikurensis (strain NBRC 102666 / KCTC 22515 / FYK2301M01) TaxID=1142394 RepID=I0ICX3_PHYMF|nr:LacI family DNA-binding transcriptional regulator [Phycisphaera mikurensis]MBB6442241.1 LacI family transcriptional regulator [Phycisphaera mikurensis]BAM03111.1 putative LacI family transcriptional regulator [Phycisphaera mikurensis NBRC 102666]